MKYFMALRPGAESRNKSERLIRIANSDKTKTKRYFAITGGNPNPVIYNWGVQEENRVVLTRWRLGCTNLAIIKCRYSDGRVSDKCSVCNILEDEFHVLYICRLYNHIRSNFVQLLNDYPTVNELLDPKNKEDANDAGRYIYMIEDQRKKSLHVV